MTLTKGFITDDLFIEHFDNTETVKRHAWRWQALPGDQHLALKVCKFASFYETRKQISKFWFSRLTWGCL